MKDPQLKLAWKIHKKWNDNKKRTCQIVDFAVPADHWGKLKESEKKDKYLDLARELTKMWNMKVSVIPIVIGTFLSHQRIIKGTGGIGNKRTSGDHPNYYIIENGQNTEMSPGNLRRLAVTQTSMKDYQPTLMGKTLKE